MMKLQNLLLMTASMLLCAGLGTACSISSADTVNSVTMTGARHPRAGPSMIA